MVARIFFPREACKKVGGDALGKSYFGKEQIRRGVQAFFDRFPDGKFENLKVVVAGNLHETIARFHRSFALLFSRLFSVLRKAFLTATLSPTIW
jgi:hypothetical protein